MGRGNVSAGGADGAVVAIMKKVRVCRLKGRF